ncbi:MAG TPA: penicillin acylase family protein, partial [Bacteroidota bacterium]
MQKRSRLLIGIGFFFLTVFLVLAYLAYHLATKSFPVTDGSVVAEGLEKPVDIYRDSFGVPHILAESDHDAWFAAGFVQAQDRLWQME